LHGGSRTPLFYIVYLTNKEQRVAIKSANTYDNVYHKWDKVQHQVPQGFICDPLHLPPNINLVCAPVLLVDDTSIIIIND
jgi:hypothetical protein